MTTKKPLTRPGVLITVSGPDAPGITSELTSILAIGQARILDIGQAVIHGLLSLTILFETPPEQFKDKTTIKDLLFKANEMGMRLDFQIVDLDTFQETARKSRSQRYAVTLIGDPLSSKALHRVTHALASAQINIDSIQRLSETTFRAIELQTSSENPIDVREVNKTLFSIAREEQIDVALQAEGLFRRAKRLVVMDVDSTLIENEVIDEFAREMGTFDQVAAITHEAMAGNLPFDESLRRRCEMLRGLTREHIQKVYGRIEVTKGARELIRVLRTLGYKIAIISGGFTDITDRLKAELKIDYAYANQLEFDSTGKCTGRVIPPIVNAQRKADLLDVIAQQEQISLDQVIAIGDGANDLLMLEKAGLGIAFSAKPVVSERADLALSKRNLRSVFYLLGLSSRQVSEVLQG
jgi:phosphoserine phosphatase